MPRKPTYTPPASPIPGIIPEPVRVQTDPDPRRVRGNPTPPTAAGERSASAATAGGDDTGDGVARELRTDADRWTGEGGSPAPERPEPATAVR